MHSAHHGIVALVATFMILFMMGYQIAPIVKEPIAESTVVVLRALSVMLNQPFFASEVKLAFDTGVVTGGVVVVLLQCPVASEVPLTTRTVVGHDRYRLMESIRRM